MAEPTNTILLVDPDVRGRAFLASQLRSLGCKILEASDGPTAMRIVNSEQVKLVVTELYLATGSDACLIGAIRGIKALRKTRTLAHTNRSLPVDREWAMTVGADAYLIKPTRAERMRYVVGRLTTERGASASVQTKANGSIVRRDSLDLALDELEKGTLPGTSSIVFGRAWWQQQTSVQQSAYRRRAKAARVSLRSDSMLKNNFVEVRGTPRVEPGLATERPESPYRR
jgi:CheY-like chemotaxis protein